MSVNNLSKVMKMISRQRKRNDYFVNKILGFDYRYDYNFTSGNGPFFYVNNWSGTVTAALTNLDLDEETLNSITDKGLVYLPIPTMQAPSGTNTQKEFDLSNLDFNQTYYMTFRPLYSGIYQAGFGIKSSTETPIIDFYDGSVLGYTFGTWQNSKILVGTGTVRRAFPYYNLGKPFSVYGPEHGLQALLNINLGVFTVWPIEISFEDFYNSNLLGIKN